MNNASGNALFLILIAVALFAALSYAVTNSGRGGGGVDKERLMLDASQMVQYAGTVRNAVQRMVLFGVDPADLNFFYNSNDETAVFFPSGGAITKLDAPANPGLNSTPNYIFFILSDNRALEGINTPAPDVIMYISLANNAAGLALCNAINDLLDIDPMPTGTGNWWEVTDGNPIACVKGSFQSSYVFYIALYEG